MRCKDVGGAGWLRSCNPVNLFESCRDGKVSLIAPELDQPVHNSDHLYDACEHQL